MLKKLSFQIGFVCLFVFLLASSALASENGIVSTKLPLPANYVHSNATEMNDNGQIIGYAYDANWQNKAVFWNQGQVVEMGVIPGTNYTYPTHLNNRGQVIGTSDNSSKAWIWENGVYTVLDKLNANDTYTIPQFINDQGIVAGISYDQSYKISSWVWQNGQFTKLADVPGTTNSQIRGLNESGQVIGFSYDSNYVYQPWIWQNGQYTNLVGISGSTQSYPQFLNNQGEVIGSSYISNTTKYWMWKQGQLTELTGLAGKPNVQIFGLNNQGQVLGMSYDQNWTTRQAWIMKDSQYTEIPTFQGLTNTNVNTLNDLGQVVGMSYDANYSTYKSWIWSNGEFTSLENLPGSSNTYVNQARDMMMYDLRQVMSNTQLLGSADSSALVWKLAVQPAQMTTPIITANKTALTNSDVQIAIAYSAGAMHKQYRIGSGPWTEYTTPLAVGENGTIEAKAISASGQESEIARFEVSNIDKIAPTATVAYSTTSSTNQAVTATITASEDVTITNNNGLNSYTFTENGTTTFAFVDAAGNAGTVTATVSNIDKMAPTTSDNATADWVNHDVALNLIATDNASGVSQTTYTLDNGTHQEGTTVILTTDGIHTVIYRSTDFAGNMEDLTRLQLRLIKQPL